MPITPGVDFFVRFLMLYARYVFHDADHRENMTPLLNDAAALRCFIIIFVIDNPEDIDAEKTGTS